MARTSLDGPYRILDGWIFAVPLLSILLFHEFGHYIMARRHGVEVSPPYFIPFPNLIGTMGALITFRSRIDSRRQLLDIGAAGPLAGLVPSVILMVLGYQLSTVGPMVTDQIVLSFGDSLLTLGIQYLVVGPVPEGFAVWIHPVGFAGWVGLFVTWLNLLPVSQLDGGHITYALIGRRQWAIGPVMIVAIFVLGLLVSRWWWYYAAFMAVLILILAVILSLIYRTPVNPLKLFSLKHFPVPDEEPLDGRRRLIGWLCLAIFILSFIPIPIQVLNTPSPF